jgi:hypothetical protein
MCVASHAVTHRQEQQEFVFLNEVKVCPELHTEEHVATPKVIIDGSIIIEQATTCLSRDKMEVCELDEIVTNNVKFGDGPQCKFWAKSQLCLHARMTSSGAAPRAVLHP